MSYTRRLLFGVGLVICIAGFASGGGTYACRSLGNIKFCTNLGDTQCRADDGCDEVCVQCFGPGGLPATVCVYDPEGAPCEAVGDPHACGIRKSGDCNGGAGAACGCNAAINWGECSEVFECELP